MKLGIEGRVALICGASKGFGYAIAQSMAQEGVRLALCARTPGPLEAAAQSLRQNGAEVYAQPCDVTRGDDLKSLVDGVMAHYGRIDILIANTGHPKMGNFMSLNEGDWHDGFNGILLPVIRLCHLVLPIMQTQQWGRIINISSSAIRTPSSVYLISGVYRTAIASLSKSLANEYGRDGILVNTVLPGLFRTPLGEDILQQGAARRQITPEEAEADYAAQTAVGRIGEPEQLGGLITFLCGKAASHITGQLITIDGGKSPSFF